MNTLGAWPEHDSKRDRAEKSEGEAGPGHEYRCFPVRRPSARSSSSACSSSPSSTPSGGAGPVPAPDAGLLPELPPEPAPPGAEAGPHPRGGGSRALLLIVLVGGVGVGLYSLVAPATEWIAKAPESVGRVQRKLRTLRAPHGADEPHRGPGGADDRGRLGAPPVGGRSPPPGSSRRFSAAPRPS